MLLFILLLLVTIFLIGITTIPLPIPLLVIYAVVFRKSWIFFLAFGLGLLLDLFLLRSLGQTGLIFILLIFLVFLYEKKFETQTLTFVFFSTFLGSFIYLVVFGYNNALVQSFVNAVIGILFFKFLWLKLDPRSETI